MVVDCDSHVMEPPDLWQRYLEPKFRDRAIRIELVDGEERLVIGERVVLRRVLAALGGAHIDRVKLFAGGLRYVDGCPPASYQPAARAELLDSWGVDRGVLFPTVGILPFPTEDVELASAYCRAYNTWQAEFSQTIPDRVVPIAVVNWHDVPTAAESWIVASGSAFAACSCRRRRLPASVRAMRPSTPSGSACRMRTCPDACM